MSEWIESHASLPRHPKTRRLARLLGCTIHETVGYLHMLWYYVMDFAPGGDLSGQDPSDIAEACEWPGDPQAFIDALVTVTFCDKSDGLTVHNWVDYNTSYRKRLTDADRQRQKRLRDRENPDVSRSVTVTGVTVTPDRQTDRTDRTDRKKSTAASEKTPQETETLAVLESIEAYPFDEATDLALLRERRDPRLDTTAEARKYRDYWAPKWKAWKKKDPPNFRLSWRNWLEKAEGYCKEKNGPLPGSHVPFDEKYHDVAPGVPPPPEVQAIMDKMLGRSM